MLQKKHPHCVVIKMWSIRVQWCYSFFLPHATDTVAFKETKREKFMTSKAMLLEQRHIVSLSQILYYDQTAICIIFCWTFSKILVLIIKYMHIRGCPHIFCVDCAKLCLTWRGREGMQDSCKFLDEMGVTYSGLAGLTQTRNEPHTYPVTQCSGMPASTIVP